MQIDIQARHFSLTEAIGEHVQRRMAVALRSHYDHVKRVFVRLSDINGPRGGRDKRCHIQVSLPGQEDIVIEDTQSNLYVAIDRAAERVKRTITRKTSRRRTRAMRPTAVPVIDHEEPGLTA